MKLFWKVFLSTIAIVVVTFGAGGFLLIDSQFRSSLRREVQLAQDENYAFRYSLNASIQNVLLNEETASQVISNAAQSMQFGASGRSSTLCILDAKDKRIYSNGILQLVPAVAIDSVPEGMSGWQIQTTDGRHYVHIACPMTFQGISFSIENFRDISELFQNRDIQYASYQQLMAVLIAINGVLLFLITAWLLMPVKWLSGVARQMANGSFDKRVKVRGRDEISQLARDFNAMAEHVQRYIAELTDASRRQEDFVASFAHELKTPLTSMIGYADMLRSKNLSNEQMILSADYIFQEGRRLEKLALKLMDLIVLKKHDIALRRVDTAQLIQLAGAVIQPALSDAGIALHISAESVVLLIEPDLMKTVLINLLDNARKALDGRGDIWLSGRRTQRGYAIIVSDNGKGIPQEELTRITEAFYMVDKSRARAQGGAGLGLAICSEIIKLHGAKLRFASVPGQGTKATVMLNGGEEA